MLTCQETGWVCQWKQHKIVGSWGIRALPTSPKNLVYQNNGLSWLNQMRWHCRTSISEALEGIATSTSRWSFGHKAPGRLVSNWRKPHNTRAYFQTLPKAFSKEPPIGWSSLRCHLQKASPWTLFGRRGAHDLKQPPMDPYTAPGCWGRWPKRSIRVGISKWNLLHSTPRVVSSHRRISLAEESSSKVSHDSVEASCFFLDGHGQFPDLPS